MEYRTVGTHLMQESLLLEIDLMFNNHASPTCFTPLFRTGRWLLNLHNYWQLSYKALLKYLKPLNRN